MKTTKSSIGLIIEGLHKIDEASNYNSKLKDFIGNESQEVQSFIKKALNDLFLGLKKDGNGYIEGKRPTIKDYGTYKTMTMKIQTKELVGGKMYQDVSGLYWKSYGKYVGSSNVDGETYSCVFYDLEDNLDTENMRLSEYGKLTDIEKRVIVGVTTVGYPHSYSNKYWYNKGAIPSDVYSGKVVDKSYRGCTYAVIVSLPKSQYFDVQNKFMTKDGNTYVFSNNYKNQSGYTYSVSYNSGNGEFHITEYKVNQSGIGDADRFNIIYKKSRNSYKAYQELAQVFNKDTTREEVEGILKKNGVRLEHSYWFNPYTD